MKRNLLAVVLLLCSGFGIMASEGGVISNANKNDVRFIKNNKRLPDVAYQQELRERDSWKNFMNANGTWYVVFNEENAKPHRAFGHPIPVFGMDAEAKALNFINTKLSGFSIPVSDLSLRSNVNSQKFQYVHFFQKYNGLTVLGSDLYVKMTPDGKVISFGCDVFNDISISTAAGISSAMAGTKAQAGLVDPIVSTVVNPELFILPIPEFKENVYKLVYEVTVSTLDNTMVPARYKTLVDATTGEILSRTNEVKHETAASPAPAPAAATDVTITGTVYPTNPYAPSATVPLRNLKIVESATTYHSDSLGYVGLAASSPTTVNLSLEGYWSKVKTGTVTPAFSATVNPGSNNLSFDSDANIRELSAYYHVNIIHDYMKTKFPAFTGMDIQLPTNVDLTTGTCNAFYDGTSINFYALGGGCNSMAQIGDVVYHEYGHGINNTYYGSLGGSFQNGAMDEAYADTWALGVTENPVLGIGMDDVDPTVFVRRYDINKKVYPQDIVGEVHADGEIIAGAWWDTGENLANHQQMMNLYSETFNGLVTGPDGTEGQVYVDVLIEALTDDDVPANGGDNDITNGTPNDNAIVDAFALHGITLLSNATVIHTAVMSSPAMTAIPITANVSVVYPWALSAVKVYYKLNRTGAWTGLSMTNTSGTTYTASIPAQPQGTVIGYYIGLEGTTGVMSAVQPVAADLANPNIPYFILNGVTLMHEEDFDDNFGAWGVGIPSDDATTGLWVVDVPIGSFYTPGDPSTIVQPDQQHTPGGQYCAITGNAPNASSALGTSDVDGGETTLESPIYDLSSYTTPIFTYYRWYINNPPSGANPGNDTWEVQISNDGTTWVKVERTNVSDKSWRRFAFRVKDYVTLSSNVQVRFVAEDSVIVGAYLDGGSLVEAAVDDMYLYEEGVSGVNESQSLLGLSVYPNPATNAFTVNYQVMKSEDMVLEIYNATGSLVYKEVIAENGIGVHRLKVESSGFSPGLYFLNLKTGKQNHMQKIAITK